MAKDLIKILVDAKQDVPGQLRDMAVYGGGGGGGGGEFIFPSNSLPFAHDRNDVGYGGRGGRGGGYGGGRRW